MNPSKILSAVALVVIACGGSSGPRPEPPGAPGSGSAASDPAAKAPAAGSDTAAAPPCEPVIAHMMKVTPQQESAQVTAAAQRALTNRCNADGWADEVRRCIAAMKVPADGDRCEQLLTPAQHKLLFEELTRELEAAGVRPVTKKP